MNETPKNITKNIGPKYMFLYVLYNSSLFFLYNKNDKAIATISDIMALTLNAVYRFLTSTIWLISRSLIITESSNSSNPNSRLS